MLITWGYGGWIRVSDDERPGWLYLRLARDADGLWRTVELYLDCQDASVTAEMLSRRLPLSRIEAIATQGDGADRLERDEHRPSPQMSLMAQSFASRRTGKRPNCDSCGSLVDPKHGRHLDWLETSWWAQVENVEVRRPRAPRQGLDEAPATAPRLSAPDGRLTEAFLRSVQAAYDGAIREGKAPAPTLAMQAGVPMRTVHRWVYTARKRGIMPGAALGRAGGRA